MIALVAGGAGFLGSHLCERLLAEGQRVVCVDNLITGRRRNVAHLARHPGFRFVHHDITQPLDLACDRIYHLASPASPGPYARRSYLRFSVETALANSIGTRHLLELARARGARVLVASTSEVYGNPTVHPQPEAYWGNVYPLGSRSCYDESKRFAEALAMAYVRRYGVDGRVARIFNCYGPRMDPKDGRLVPNLVTQALRQKLLTISGDGTQTRSLCYVDDIVRGLIAIMEAPAGRGEVYNLGHAEEHTVLEFARLIRELRGSSSGILFLPLPADDPARRRPDTTKVRATLGWEPRVGLREGLARTIEWFRLERLAGQGRSGGRTAGHAGAERQGERGRSRPRKARACTSP